MKTKRHPAPRIEALEARIAPATLVSASIVTFQDVDGDDVTVKFSKPILTDDATANMVMKFATGTAINGNATPQQLQLIAVTWLPGGADGVSITVSAKRSATNGGDGFVNVGAVDASGTVLGSVKIAGDLGQIDAGNGTNAIKKLDVQSMGEFGTTTQMGGGNLQSDLSGAVGSLGVKGNIRDAFISVTGGAAGTLGKVTIGGSLLGGGGMLSGRISSDGDMGAVKIGGSLSGGGGDGSGFLVSFGKLAGLTIGGSIIGGGGLGSGKVFSQAGIGAVKIGQDIIGGPADETGVVRTTGDVKSVTIGGSIIGGGGFSSGRVFTLTSSIGAVKIGGNLVGGTAIDAGEIEAAGTLKSVTIGGSIIGGSAKFSGAIVGKGVDDAGKVGSIKIGGRIEGGGGLQSGGVYVEAAPLGSVTVGGSIIGGAGISSGAISAKVIGSAKIVGSIIGGGAEDAGGVKALVDFGKAFVGGSIVGGSAPSTGTVASDGTLGSVVVKGDLRGGAAVDSGSIDGDDNIGSVTIVGSIYAGSVPVVAIASEGSIKKVAIGGSVFGTAAAPISIAALGSPDNQVAIGSLALKGSAHFLNILGGDEDGNTNAAAQLGKILVGGNWIASNAAAGVDPVDGLYGNGNDVGFGAGASRIASIIIKGYALGTAGGADHFGIVAREVGAVKVGSVKIALTPGASGDLAGLPVGATGDFLVREIA